MKPIALGLALALTLGSGAAQAALNYNFSGTDAGGTGSATMSFNLDGWPTGNVVEVSLNNTSPILNLSGPNSPGIAGFGFNFLPDGFEISDLQSWSLSAQDGGTTVQVGGSTCAACDWILGTFQDGTTLEFLPQLDNGVDGALYNPLATSVPGGANDSYFTEAILTLDFKDSLAVTDIASAYVRMKNVGRDGGGSLKLTGTPNGNGGGGNVPEPGSLGLLGIALIGMLSSRRRKSPQAN